MNEQLQLALSQLVEKSMTGVDKSIDFLSAEIPDVIYQLLMWYGVKSALYTLIGIVLMGVFIPINKKLLKLIKGLKSEDPYEDYDFMYVGLAIGNCCYVGVTFACISLTWLKIWIAPKVWLLDYATNFVK